MATALQTMFLFFATLKFISIISQINACNEFVCASIVTKCLLIQSCDCSVTSCSCCPSCLRCLGNFYTECCNCVGMCENETPPLNSTSIFHEESLTGSPELFRALLSDPDPGDSWVILEFPVKVSEMITEDTTQWYGQQRDRIIDGSINCSLVFLDDCTSQGKCKKICESMGAETSVWFQDGCCECSGCPRVAIFENRCSNCPLDDEIDLMEDYDDFGEDDNEETIYDQMELDAESQEQD